jgi:hypothetical protein
MPIPIGTHLGSHEITGLLGKGGMGEVYQAIDPRLVIRGLTPNYQRREARGLMVAIVSSFET